ncbi:MAG: hypothetical protein O8C61_12265 [Candidatus Methanoperedens sp.]|nr:hypothetical protein [Candidatus Methanoperedens sp.]
MKKSTVLIAIIVVALIIGAVYVSIDKIESTLNIGKPALKLTISTRVNESDGSPIITNMTFEQTQVIYKGADSPVVFPDISVIARNESLLADPISYWASEQRVGGSEKHTLTLAFRDSFKPKTGDLLILTIRFTSYKGNILGKNTAFYEWK